MTFKTFFITCLLSVFLMSCKTSSSIITSKQEAQNRGIYRAPEKQIATKTAKKKEIIKVETEAKKTENKRIIVETEEADYIISPEKNDYLAEQIINKAKEFQGVNYRTGGIDTDGMDCSGLIIASFSDYNIKLPRTSNEMSRTGVEINKSEAQKGDLIFFRTNGRRAINHVGIVIDAIDGEIQFIHSSTHQGVMISSTKEIYYKKAFAQVNRVL